MSNLIVIENKGSRVLTTLQVAKGYGVDDKRISENFNRNKERYIEGVHYFKLQGLELKGFKANTQIEVLPNLNTLYLWTEKGTFLHAKSLNTDKAWEVYEKLVETYFRVNIEQKEPTFQIPQTLSQALMLASELAFKNEQLIIESQQQAEVIHQQQDTIYTHEEVIKALTTKCLGINDRTLVVNLIRSLSPHFGGYSEAFNSFYKVLTTRLSIDVNLRSKRCTSKCRSKISFITAEEWCKVVPLLISWYLTNGGEEKYMVSLINGTK